MKTRLSARDALALVPGLDANAIEIRTLAGGLSNRSYEVRHGEQRFVLRLDAAKPAAFQPDRALELRALGTASAAGFAPEVTFADPTRGVLLYRFVEGRQWTATDLESEQNLHELALTLRDVHALPPTGKRISMPETAEVYCKYIERQGNPNSFGRYCAALIGSMPPLDTVTFCHNDIVAGNIIGNGKLTLIDWEFASDNEPLFDLASLIGFHDLNAHQATSLLASYCGRPDRDARERLDRQRIIYDAIQWLWLAARQQDVVMAGGNARLARLKDRILTGV
jgi:thiamine kinase-like enzyme